MLENVHRSGVTHKNQYSERNRQNKIYSPIWDKI